MILLNFYQHPCIHIYLQIHLLRTSPTLPHSKPSSCHIEPSLTLYSLSRPSHHTPQSKILFLYPTSYAIATPTNIFLYLSYPLFAIPYPSYFKNTHLYLQFCPPTTPFVPPHPIDLSYWISLTYSLPHPSYDITQSWIIIFYPTPNATAHTTLCLRITPLIPYSLLFLPPHFSKIHT